MVFKYKDKNKMGLHAFIGYYRFGDLHEANAEITRLTAANTKLEESVPNKIAELNRSFNTQVEEAAEKKAEKKTKTLKTAKENAERELAEEKLKTTRLEADKQQLDAQMKRIKVEYEDRLCWRDNLLTSIGRMFYQMYESFRKAVQTLIRFIRSPFDVLDADEAKTIRDVMDEFAKEGSSRTDVGNWLIATAEDKNGKTIPDKRIKTVYSVVDDVAHGGYDTKISQNFGVSR